MSIFDNTSPNNEVSIFKWIPIQDLESTKIKLKSLWPNVKFRIRYRGPRYDTFRLTTLKSDATHFSVYTYPIKNKSK